MKTFIILATGILLLVSCGENTLNKVSTLNIPDKYEQRVDSVLKLMTLDEKIGQLNQYTGNWQATGPVVEDPTKIEQIKAGKVGSMLNIKSVKHTRELQEYAMQSRLRIPLMFGLDVVHGLRTIYPIPLGEAASFDLDLMRRTAAGAAKESSAQGVHWTFAHGSPHNPIQNSFPTNLLYNIQAATPTPPSSPAYFFLRQASAHNGALRRADCLSVASFCPLAK